MWPSEKMKFSPYVIISILLFIFVIETECLLSDKKLCGDPDCSEPVSTGRTLVDYPSGDSDILSFRKNNRVIVYSKSAGSRDDLWGVEINGVKGYAPKRFVREDKILKRDLKFIIDIPPKINSQSEDLPSSASINENVSIKEEINKSDKTSSSSETVKLAVDPVEIKTSTEGESHENIKPNPTNYEIIGDTTIYISEVQDNLSIQEKNVIETVETTKNKIDSIHNLDSDKPLLNQNSDKTNVNVDEVDSISTVNEIITPTNKKTEFGDVSRDPSIPPVPEVENATNENSDTLITNIIEPDIKQNLLKSNINVNIDNLNKLDINIDLKDTPKLDVKLDVISEHEKIVEQVKPELEKTNAEEIDKVADQPQINTDIQNFEEQKVLSEDKNHSNGGNVEDKIYKREVQNEKIETEVKEEPNKQNGITTLEKEVKNSEITHSSKSITNNSYVENQNQTVISMNGLDNLKEIILPTKDADSSKTTEASAVLKVTTATSSLLFAKAEEIPVESSKPLLKAENLLMGITEPVFVDKEVHVTDTIRDVPSIISDITNTENSVKSADLQSTTEIPSIDELVLDKNLDSEDSAESQTKPSTENAENSVKSADLPSTTEIPFIDEQVLVSKLDFDDSAVSQTKHSTENAFIDVSIPESSEDISNNLKDSLKLLQDQTFPPFKKLSNDPVLKVTIDTIVKTEDTKENLDFLNNQEKTTANPIEPIGIVEEIRFDKTEKAAVEENIEYINKISDKSGYFDWIYNMLFASSEDTKDIENIREPYTNIDEKHNGLLSQVTKDVEVCSAEICAASDNFLEPDLTKSSFTYAFLDNMTTNSGSTVIYLSVTAITILFFTLGYYYIEKWRQDGSLLRKVNTLEQALMVTTKENEILKENLESTQTKLTSIKEGAFGSNEEVQALQEEKKKMEMIILDKEKQILDLQKEFEAATETGLELNKMLQDMMITAQKGDTIAESMEQAQMQLNEQKETINSMNAALAARSKENNSLQLKINDYEIKIDSIQKLLNEEKSENKAIKEEKSKIQEQFNSIKDQLDKVKEENTYEIQQMRSSLSEAQRDLYAKTNQVQLLEDCIKKIKSGNTIEVSELAKTAELQSDLQRVTAELQSLKERGLQDTLAKQKLEEKIKTLTNEIMNVKDEHHKAEKDKMEAQTRLEVLSSYFKEKETQLQKELGIQEALWQQKQGEATSTVERLHSMQDEIQSLRSQNQSLHTEIEQQAAAHRTQTTALESRVHEAWLNYRQTQRKLEESRQEATALRRKLTSLVEQDNMQKRGSSPLEVQLSATSPIHMNSAVSPILPPPPMPFLPPPFLPPPIGNHPPPPSHFIPPFMGDMRPPPLGRLPSPPRQRRGNYSPSMASERYSPESRAYSPESRVYSPESRAFSPDSRAYSPDYRRPISPYDTETDISPPATPYRNKYNSYSNRRDEQKRSSKGMISAESNETINRNGRSNTSKAV